jgi:hypothetical protein
VKDGQLLVSTSRQRTSAVGGSSAVALALLAGFVASVVMVLAFGVAFALALALSRTTIPLVSGWFAGLTSNSFIDAAAPNLYAAAGVFLVGGVIWALVYGLFFERRLSGAGWQRGVKFALLPWAVSLVVLLPLAGGGLLGFGLGAGPLPIIGNLLLHAVYGAVLGAIYGSADSVLDNPAHAPSEDDLRLGRLSEVSAARGLVIGIAGGLILGIVLAIPMQAGVSLNPAALVVAITLTGAAFGALIGSFASR